MNSRLDHDGTIDLPFGDPRFDVARIIGPFFLGICFACFGTGIVLVLAIHYLRQNQHSCKLKFIIALVLFLNVGQTAADLSRGWHMYAESFLSIPEFLAPPLSFFISPFLGLFPTVVTQLFLLRRSHRFLTSLRFLFPTMAHPFTRTLLATTMILGILLTFGAGVGASWEVYSIGNLAKLGQEWAISRPFHRLSRIWLLSSSLVDVCICIVLCWELWWARERLTDPDVNALGQLNRGKGSNGILFKLILVTLHGGVAVTAIQISALALMYTNMWKSGSFAYMIFISIGKVYTITLLLSISVPQAGSATSKSFVPSGVDCTPHLAAPVPAPRCKTSSNQSFQVGILQGVAIEPSKLERTLYAKFKIRFAHHITKWATSFGCMGNAEKVGSLRRESYQSTTESQRSVKVDNGSLGHQAFNRTLQDTTFVQKSYTQPKYRGDRRPSEPSSVTCLLSPRLMASTPPAHDKGNLYPSHCLSLPFLGSSTKAIPLTIPPPSRSIHRHHSQSGLSPSTESTDLCSGSQWHRLLPPLRPFPTYTEIPLNSQQVELGSLETVTETGGSQLQSQNRDKLRQSEVEPGLMSLMDMLGDATEEQSR